MAVIQNIENQYFYIHNNYDNALGSLAKIELLNRENEILKRTIDAQILREQKIYEIAKVNTVEELYESLFGIKTEKNLENELDSTLRVLWQYFVNVYTYNGTSMYDKKFKFHEGAALQILQSFYNIKNDFSNWLKISEIDQGQINIEHINQILTNITSFMNSSMKNLLNKDGVKFEIKENNGKISLDGNLTSEGANQILEKILKRYVEGGNDLFGMISESGSVYCKAAGSKWIRMSTSDWFNKNDKNNDYLLSEIQQDNMVKKYKKQLEDLKNEVIKQNIVTESFSIKASSLLKADEVFGIETKIDGDSKIFTFGISNKLGRADITDLKIQQTSLSAILSNIYILKNYGNVEYISKAIQFIMVNEAGVLNWENKISLSNVNTYIQEILQQLIKSFSYLWFTGGDIMGSAHADFFLVTKNGKTFFVPFSKVLIAIQNNLSNSNSFFASIGFNKISIPEKEMDEIKKRKNKDDENHTYLEGYMKNIFKNTIKGISKDTQIKITDYTNII